MVILLTLAVWLGVDLYWEGSKCRFTTLKSSDSMEEGKRLAYSNDV